MHVDADHHRSVFTLVGEPSELVETLLGGIALCTGADRSARARRRASAHRRRRRGSDHPDPKRRPERAPATALTLARRIGDELELPVFLYGELAPGRGPAFFRRGGPEELQRRIDAGELAARLRPARLDERAGGVIVGARRPLIAFNVNLRARVEAARAIASGRAGNRRRLPRGTRARARAHAGGSRPGVDERRGLGGGSLARDRREDRNGGCATRGGGRRLGARGPHAGRSSGCRRGRDAPDRRLRRVACVGASAALSRGRPGPSARRWSESRILAFRRTRHGYADAEGQVESELFRDEHEVKGAININAQQGSSSSEVRSRRRT